MGLLLLPTIRVCILGGGGGGGASLLRNTDEFGSHGFFSSHLPQSRRRPNRGVSKPWRHLHPWASISAGYNDDVGFCEDSEIVEVIGIGSRRDAVLDFCLRSKFQSTSLRFWYILEEDSPKVLLQQSFLGKDLTPRVVEPPFSLQTSSKAIALVAGAAHGSDYMTALEILKRIRSANGSAVGLIIKPFTFEGKRRQDEVMYMVDELQEHDILYMVIDMDELVTNNSVTLDKALRTANNAVFFALNAISLLISKQKGFVAAANDNMKELEVSNLTTIVKRHKEAKIGFGVGYSLESSTMEALLGSPFLNVDIVGCDGTIVCVLASSHVVNNSDIKSFLQNVNQITNYRIEMFISTIEERSLDPGVVISTVLFFGGRGPSKKSMLSKVAQHLSFVFNILRERDPKTKRTRENLPRQNRTTIDKADHYGSVEVPVRLAVGEMGEDSHTHSGDLQELHPPLSRNISQTDALRGVVGIAEDNYKTTDYFDPNTEASERHELISWNVGTGYQIAQDWARERAVSYDAALALENPNLCLLPVGVKLSKDLPDASHISKSAKHPEDTSLDGMSGQSLLSPKRPAQNKSTNSKKDAVIGFYEFASTLKNNYADAPRKGGLLSIRAASMLEAERDLGKKWNPVVEMKYQGGFYKGHCQGGLPDGKGRLSHGDGSMYDGMWRSGRRAGPGAFFYSNGDVFQGSWRDDVMHGKGWFYFHNGDRWFANFWKGKANGEGRFYFKAGDIFFGSFQDGWRHGEFLYIKVNGTRFVEIWDQGVLVSRDQL